MDKFVARANIAHYRKMLEETDEANGKRWRASALRKKRSSPA
jgi:hypothetical protein